MSFSTTLKVNKCPIECNPLTYSLFLQRNSKLDLSKSDLIKLVSMLEGELEAMQLMLSIVRSEQVIIADNSFYQ